MKMTDKIKRWLWNIITSGLPVDYDIEVLRKILLLNLIIILGSFFLSLLGITAFVQRDFVLGVTDLTILSFLLWLFRYLRKTKDHNFAGMIGTIATGVFYFFLAAHGGVGNTAYIWAFTYPLISLFLLGTKMGSLMSLLLLGMTCTVFAFGANVVFFTSYSIDLIIRFIPAYVTVYLFALVMEKVREIVQYRLKTSNVELEKAIEGLEKGNERLQREIKEHKQTEAALRESEERFRTIFETAQDSIFIKDTFLRYTHVNFAMERLFELPSSKLVGRSDSELFGEEAGAHIMEVDSRVLGGEIIEEEHTKPVKGISTTFHVIKVPMQDLSGKSIGLCGIARDVTDRKQAEETLQQSYKNLKITQAQLVQSGKLASIGELSSGVAHELNQPLMVIRGTAQVILRNILKNEFDENTLPENLSIIVKNTKRMMNIIEHLRIFSRQSPKDLSHVDVNMVIEDCFLMVGEQLRIHNIEVEKHLAPDLPKTKGNYNQLEQVFLNLITNARDALEERRKYESDRPEGEFQEGDRLEIMTRVSGEYKNAIEILFKDSGNGIPAGDAGKIFDPFFTTKEADKGTGLGLSISYGIIKDHKGEIEVTETGPDGTTFRIRLPIVDLKAGKI